MYKEIIKEFREKFGKKNSYDLYKVDRPTEYKNIEQFWLSKLEAQKEDLLKKTKRIVKEMEEVIKIQNKGFGYDMKRAERWIKEWKKILEQLLK